MMAFIDSVFHVIGSFISMVFEVVGLVALVITRRKNYKQAKADEPRVIHMDNGETFKSYYSK